MQSLTPGSQFCLALFHGQENASNYDKGVLAEILEPIMGKVCTVHSDVQSASCRQLWLGTRAGGPAMPYFNRQLTSPQRTPVPGRIVFQRVSMLSLEGPEVTQDFLPSAAVSDLPLRA